MAEALSDLGGDVSWAPSSAPRGEFVLLQDSVASSGEFLVHHFVSLFLKAGHRVCFVTFARSKDHYAAVARKLGVNFAATESAKQLQVLDHFQAPESTLSDPICIYEALEAICRHEASDLPVSIVIDDLSVLKWSAGVQAVHQFMRCCKTLTHKSNGAANVVVLSHTDTDPPSGPGISSLLQPLNPALVDMATVVFTAQPLATGYCRDVHGTLSVQRQCKGLSVPSDPVTVSYKILETTIKCFRSGGDALRSI